MGNTREHQNKVASKEYLIPRSPTESGGYRNLGVSTVLIFLAAISKRLAAGQSTFQAKEQTQSKIATRKTANIGKCATSCSPGGNTRGHKNVGASLERNPDPTISLTGVLLRAHT